MSFVLALAAVGLPVVCMDACYANPTSPGGLSAAGSVENPAHKAIRYPGDKAAQVKFLRQSVFDN